VREAEIGTDLIAAIAEGDDELSVAREEIDDPTDDLTCLLNGFLETGRKTITVLAVSCSGHDAPYLQILRCIPCLLHVTPVVAWVSVQA